MRNDFPALLAGFGTSAPATAEAIADCERRLQRKLPADYVELLALTNGGEGFIGDGGFVRLWSVEELPTLNDSYQIDLAVPGLIAFGTDGAGEAYCFDMRGPETAIVQIPFVGMEPETIDSLASDFSGFLQYIRTLVD